MSKVSWTLARVDIYQGDIPKMESVHYMFTYSRRLAQMSSSDNVKAWQGCEATGTVL